MKSKWRSVKHQSGFTILEVLVAFLVAALLLSMILSGFSTGMSQLLRADRISQAAIVAQSRLAEVGVVVPLQEAHYEGQDQQFPDYRWQVNVVPFTWELSGLLAEQGSTLYRVDIEVTWPAGRGEHNFVLSSLRLGREVQP